MLTKLLYSQSCKSLDPPFSDPSRGLHQPLMSLPTVSGARLTARLSSGVVMDNRSPSTGSRWWVRFDDGRIFIKMRANFIKKAFRGAFPDSRPENYDLLIYFGRSPSIPQLHTHFTRVPLGRPSSSAPHRSAVSVNTGKEGCAGSHVGVAKPLARMRGPAKPHFL